MVEYSPRGVRVLGITGPIGCGKSTVCRMTVELGALDYIDADRVTHELMHPETELTKAIGENFGSQVIAEDGSVDRTRLGAIVFEDPESLAQLESLVHPAVRTTIFRRIEALEREVGHGIVTVEAIRLLDSPLAERAARIWLVTCQREHQARRLAETRSYSPAEIQRRVAAQPHFPKERIDDVIENNGDINALHALVESAWVRMLEDKR